ncbi:MAG TPA: glucose 1-dehydrogenase [Anaeromyxobacteraceae bacterium]|nr:glucose 1-dehydrogenase [Anaeromyxobacteraceae bacterium]
MNDPVSAHKSIIDRFRLDGRAALVTGGGQGIGRGFALALGEAGAKVAVVDLNLALAEAVAGELTEKKVEAIALKADVTKTSEVERMVARVAERFGSLTIGVNNAGMGKWCDSEAMKDEDWRAVLSLNLDAVYWCAREEGRVMLKAGYGKIINTASMSAHIVNTPQNQAAYNASKAGVLHLTRSLAAEWAPRGVRVNSISPGYTRTKLVEDLLATPIGQKMLPAWMALTPMGRMAEVDDLVGALVYLASPASDFVTGSDVVVDGGYCCW